MTRVPAKRSKIDPAVRDLEQIEARLLEQREMLKEEKDLLSKEKEALEERLQALKERVEEDVRFWQRRAVTVVGVANTAAMLALGTAFIQAGDMVEVGRIIIAPLGYFATGVIISGVSVIIDVFSVNMIYSMALNAKRKTPLISIDAAFDAIMPVVSILRAACPIAAAGFFAIGLMEAVGVVRGVVAAG